MKLCSEVRRVYLWFAMKPSKSWKGKRGTFTVKKDTIEPEKTGYKITMTKSPKK